MPIGPLADQGRIFFVLGALLSYQKLYHQKSTAFFISNNQDFITERDHCHVTLPDLPTLRNQEKGVLAKGVSAESSVTPRILGPAAHLALRAPQPREAHILAKTPLLIGNVLKG